MKMKYKLLLGATVLILGIVGINRYQYNTYVAEQKERIELFFNYNYTIESITFTKTEKDPMGSLVFHGYFNNNKDEYFTASIMAFQKEFDRNNVLDGEFVKKNGKFENRKTYSVTEILQLQNGETLDSTENSSNSLVDKF